MTIRRKKIRGTIFTTLLLFSFLGEASSSNKAASCFACHGEKGLSASPIWPNLAGQRKGYLIKQLKDFRSGLRKDPIMSPLAKVLSDSDIEELTTYFSELK